MKKIFCIILALVVTVSLIACDISSSSFETDGNSTGSTEGATNSIATNEITFDEQIVVDNDACVIKITEIVPDSLWGYTLKVHLENKSDDTTYMFSVDTASINGVDCDPLFASEVSAGKKASEEIIFSDTNLEKILGRYTDIALSFRVYNSEDLMAESVAETTVHIYPYGEENATIYTREALESDTVIVDNDYVTVIVIDYTRDDIWGYSANLYLVNKTQTSVMFSADNVSVNGYMCDPFYANSVSAGNCAFSSITWFDTSLEECGITEIEEIELTLRAYDNENWLDDDFANVTVTLTP